MSAGLRSLARRRMVLHGAIGALLVVAVALAFVSLQRRADIAALATADVSVDDAFAREEAGVRLGRVSIGAAVLHAIAFGAFLYRAHKQLTAARITVQGNAGLAAASYFVPFANLVLPFKAAKDILDAARVEAKGLLLAWWLPFVASVVVRRVAATRWDDALADFDAGGARTALLLDAIGGFGIVVSVAIAAVVVARIATAVETCTAAP